MITSSKIANTLGLRPLAWIQAITVIESAPLYMPTGIITATGKVLHSTRWLALADIDRLKANEAFAPIVLPERRTTERA
ncbi:hypothetical protein [Mycobacterium leprae]|uniref:hypothetical protein n=1 Tax=Mycobacterium leprae TaxID=1769 RepID=UPI000314E794|nr:hypothetical protein [Mycobacterium leprae]OAR21788.1 hypothetical protein A8144_00955 [Mycobacterium leprae 3125609]OAX72330.1 hypothetical protein A3216_01035 [Mycobacterium leprae 7935681]